MPERSPDTQKTRPVEKKTCRTPSDAPDASGPDAERRALVAKRRALDGRPDPPFQKTRLSTKKVLFGHVRSEVALGLTVGWEASRERLAPSLWHLEFLTAPAILDGFQNPRFRPLVMPRTTPVDLLDRCCLIHLSSVLTLTRLYQGTAGRSSILESPTI